jgi:hypothetical protein
MAACSLSGGRASGPSADVILLSGADEDESRRRAERGHLPSKDARPHTAYITLAPSRLAHANLLDFAYKDPSLYFSTFSVMPLLRYSGWTLAMVGSAIAVHILGPVTTFPITNGIVSPDGFARAAILGGGSFPGPLIQASKVCDAFRTMRVARNNVPQNSHFQVTVQNNLNDTSMPIPTFIHWHGLQQRNSSWADGVAFVSQCPIVPGLTQSRRCYCTI